MQEQWIEDAISLKDYLKEENKKRPSSSYMTRKK
jgi:hypothetical protein